jgi:asparagine synthase (glutamine-hydrolysing)
MCGIAGILNTNERKSRDPSWIRKMTHAQQHRGPDAEGIYEDEWISLGHRRLSIIDVSEAANQPFTDAFSRYVAVFNGEIYNFRELKEQLSFYEFKTSSDTEVLLAAYIQWGTGCLERIKGMFAFAIWDRQESTLFLCRDRLGVKPLYYWQDGEFFCFASEIRSILATGLVNRRLDHIALVDFFRFQSFYYPRTPVQGISQLEAGSYLLLRQGRTEKQRYWFPGQKRPDMDLTHEAGVKSRIRTLFERSIAMRLVSDVPIGAFLSGGIDSSLVVACMAGIMTSPPRTFNISFDEQEFDESGYAGMVARHFHTEHHTIRLKPGVILEELDRALDAMDTPSADGVNTYVVSKAIRNAGIKVALSGVGGDELFAGYPFFRQIPEVMKYEKLFRSTQGLRKLLASPFMSLGGKAGRLAEIMALEDLDVRSLYPMARQIMSHAQMKRLLDLPGVQESGLDRELSNRMGLISGLPILSQISVAEYLGYTQHTLLKDTDQMSMAVALEVREPFFDHELIDFVLHVPDELKYPSTPKKLLVGSFEGLLPQDIINRRKQGFLFPWALWMKKELTSFCEERISRMAQREFIRGPELLSQWKRFREGDRSVKWASLWSYVVLEHWLERNDFH